MGNLKLALSFLIGVGLAFFVYQEAGPVTGATVGLLLLITDLHSRWFSDVLDVLRQQRRGGR